MKNFRDFLSEGSYNLRDLKYVVEAIANGEEAFYFAILDEDGFEPEILDESYSLKFEDALEKALSSYSKLPSKIKKHNISIEVCPSQNGSVYEFNAVFYDVKSKKWRFGYK